MTDKPIIKTARKPIPKSVRFEVFKRDKFSCQYCGRAAPEVLLHIDHIKPVADQGTNDITNLVTACAACNAGKRDVPLDDNTTIMKRKAQLDELQERREQLEMMMEWTQGLQDLKGQTVRRLADYWMNLAPGFSPNDRGLQKIRKCMTKFSVEEIMKAMDIAAAHYLQFKDDGNVTQESWELAYGKVVPILNVERDAKSDPDLKDLLYIRGIARKRCDNYFNNGEAMEWLRTARSWEIPMTEIKEVVLRVEKWSQFERFMGDLIDRWKKDTSQSSEDTH